MTRYREDPNGEWDRIAGNFIDISGKAFGRWKAIAPLGKRGGQVYFKARCKCGTERPVQSKHLRSGKSRDCGCGRKEKGVARLTRHGLSHHRGAFQSWHAMHNRCMNPRQPGYKHYGGRGIVICERWRLFENFFQDMGDRPEGHTLERVDVNGNYEPSNCKWIPAEKQGLNMRSNVFLEKNGEKHSIAEWARRLGIPVWRLAHRRKKQLSTDEVLYQGVLPNERG